eukprot:14548784-Alexandrium_andersonii.AAC.1
MSASLVGSEMCIRDSVSPVWCAVNLCNAPAGAAAPRALAGRACGPPHCTFLLPPTPSGRLQAGASVLSLIHI